MNVSNDASRKSEEFSIKNIEVFVDCEEQKWFKQAHVGKFLAIEDIRTLLNGLEKCEILTRQELIPNRRGTSGWFGPNDQQNKMDRFLSFFGVMYVIVNSQKDKDKVLVKHISKDIVTRGLDARIEEIQEKYRQAVTDRDNQIQALEFRNEEHQQKILKLNKEINDLIKNRYVLRRGYFDNVLCFIKKNGKEVHPYYVIQSQYRQLEKFNRCFKLRYPSMEEDGRCDDPNAIHQWNIFKCEVIEKPSYYKNNFSLTEEKRELLETILDVTI